MTAPRYREHIIAVLAHRIVSESLAVPPNAVYAFARRVENLPRWASGLATGVRREGDAWFAESPMGRIGLAMAPDNAFGVLDHDVTLPDGSTVHNAMRVTPAGDGSVLSFVVLRLTGTGEAAFAADLDAVSRDLKALKALLENGSV